MATDSSSAYIRSLNIGIYGESLSHPTGVTSVFAACTATEVAQARRCLTLDTQVERQPRTAPLEG